MSISGGIKFFEPSMNLEVNGSEISASSGDSSAPYCIDRNPSTYWRSVASNDLTTEEIVVTFDEDKTFSRLFLLDHNWKDYNVKYDVAGVWTNFANVSGLDGSVASVVQTTFADNSSYYEFDSITTGSIRIQVTKTQTANQEKYLSQIICTEEIGTLQGYPTISSVDVDRNSRVKKTLSGRYVVQKSEETFGCDLAFKNYPVTSTYNEDIDIAMALHDREESFLVWLCGGRRGTDYFRYTLRGFRLMDVIPMQITKAFKLSYASNVYINAVNASVSMEESI